MQRSEELKLLWDKIKDIRVAMLTTIDPTGHLRSRPMYTQETELKDEIWFFTKVSSPKVNELNKNMQVNLSYANPDDQLYVSVSGTAQVIKSRSKSEELWNPSLKAYFPEGLDDPELSLIKVTTEFAEYWDSPSGKMVTLFGMLKSVFSGEEYTLGENKKLDFEI